MWLQDLRTNRAQIYRIDISLSGSSSFFQWRYSGQLYWPTVLVLYVNDVVTMFNSIKCKLYADDLKTVLQNCNSSGLFVSTAWP